MHLRQMKQNGELLQHALTNKHSERLKNIADQKKDILDMISPQSGSIIDLESETGCFDDPGTECLTQIPHLKRYLRTSAYGSVKDVNKKYDAILSHNHMEYEWDILSVAPRVLSRLSAGGSWIVSLPVDNLVEKNYTGRIHEFTNESAILFAAEVSYNFASINMNNSILIVFKQDVIPA